MNRLSIIIPAYNEAEHIEGVVLSLLEMRPVLAREAKLDDVEVIVVNDGSTDTTGQKLNALASTKGEALRVVHHEENCGYGAALKTGFGAARGEYLSFMDADGTLEPEAFIRLYRELRNRDADMAVGTRFGGEEKSGMPVLRRIGNHFFANLLWVLSGERVRDTASGMRLFRKEIIPQLHPLPDGLHFTPAMSTKAIHERLKIVEVPIPYAERKGSSKLRIVSDGLRFFRIIVGTVLLYNPFKVFFLSGLLFVLVAAGLLSLPIYSWLTEENVQFSDYIYRSIGAMYFMIAGVQIMLFGVLARFIVSTFFRRYESGRLIHEINRIVRAYDRMGIYGLVLVIPGVGINALYFLQYLSKGRLQVHWAWLLLAAAFIIVGLQMVITGVVIRILKDIKIAQS